METIALQSQHRKIYRLSVIPGGIYSADELARARRTDPVVAAHYADFRSDAHVTRLRQDQWFYISYRKADKVFWSRTKHRVCGGEAVMTDGKNIARSRCGNRLSKTPMQPTAAAEPSESELNAPESPPLTPTTESGAGPLEASNLPQSTNRPGPELLPARTTPLPLVTTGAGSELDPPVFDPFLFPYYGSGPLVATTSTPSHSGSGSAPSSGTTTTATPIPGTGTTTVTTVTATPEPASSLLILLGAALAATAGRVAKPRYPHGRR